MSNPSPQANSFHEFAETPGSSIFKENLPRGPPPDKSGAFFSPNIHRIAPFQRKTGRMRLLRLFLACLILFGSAVYAFPALRMPFSGTLPAEWTLSQETATPGKLLVRDMRGIEFPYQGTRSYSPGADLGETRRLRDGLTPRSYQYYRPSTATGTAPAVILLHGANRNGRSMVEMWKAVADAHGVVLIAPNAAGNRWDTKDETMIAALHQHAVTTLDIDPAAMFLFGHSSGAIFAEWLTNAYATPFKATVTHAGHNAGGVLTPRSTGAPIRAYLGEQDHIFSIETARAAARRFSKAGHTYELVTIPGHTHWFYDIGPQIAADAWRWFASQN